MKTNYKDIKVIGWKLGDRTGPGFVFFTLDPEPWTLDPYFHG